MYTEDLVIQSLNEHVHNLCVCQIKHIIINDASGVPGPRLQSFDMLVLEISLDVTIYLVVQMHLSRQKVVCCGQLTLHWTFDH